jgi:hypothetical protein
MIEETKYINDCVEDHGHNLDNDVKMQYNHGSSGHPVDINRLDTKDDGDHRNQVRRSN